MSTLLFSTHFHIRTSCSLYSIHTALRVKCANKKTFGLLLLEALSKTQFYDLKSASPHLFLPKKANNL